jgi:hypothetical protein
MSRKLSKIFVPFFLLSAAIVPISVITSCAAKGSQYALPTYINGGDKNGITISPLDNCLHPNNTGYLNKAIADFDDLQKTLYGGSTPDGVQLFPSNHSAYENEIQYANYLPNNSIFKVTNNVQDAYSYNNPIDVHSFNLSIDNSENTPFHSDYK